MIRLFSPETFRDYLDNPSPETLAGNGTIVLSPDSCEIEANIDGDWKLTMSHPIDIYNKYTYIEKNAILVVDAKVCREQTSSKQAFRILEVTEDDDSIDVVAYPVAWESVYEFPIKADYEGYKLSEILAIWNDTYSNKYHVDSTFDTDAFNLFVSESNLQEMLNGDSGDSIKSMFDTELVYDNYDFHLLQKYEMGENKIDDVKVEFGYNITGIDISESMTDVITRIIPLSSEGYPIRGIPYIDSGNIDDFPHVFSKYQTYSDVKFVEDHDKDDTTPITSTQQTTADVRATIQAKVRELSEKYLRQAREGNWNHTYPATQPINNNPHEPGREYDQNADRAALPYGYLFYSYTDAIGVLTERVLEAANVTDESYRDLITDEIKNGFKWCEDTEIAGWDWRYETTYNSEDGDGNYNYLKSYGWWKDETGWFYGDNAGEGHYIASGWVEDATDKHYWVNASGYWEPQWDDTDPWQWYNDGNGWWYGNKNSDGTAKNYASNQWIYDSSSGNWYLIDSSGYLMDGSEKHWWYGTEDRSDVVQFKYWHIGNYIYWLNADAYADEVLVYWSDFQWREDDTGYYYGDGKGHYVRNCWVEDSSDKHYWVDANGYRDDALTDSNKWCWHGNYTDGWWYGTKDEDDTEDEDEPSVEDVCKQIKRLMNAQSSYTKSTLISNVKAQCNRVTYSSDSTIGHIYQYCEDYSKSGSKSDYVNAVNTELANTGYDLSGLGEVTEKSTLTSIKNVNDNATRYSKTSYIDAIQDYIDNGPEHTSSSTIGKIQTVINTTSYDKNTMVTYIDSYLDASGYFDDDDDDDAGTVEEYDSTKTYNVGDHVMHNGSEYKCTHKIEEAEAWNSDHWELVDDEEEEETSVKVNYAKDQYMYVSENGTWYWFDNNGYFTAAWMVDDDQWDWHQDSVGWWYGDGAGSYPTGQWMKISSKWYFFDVTGYADPGTDDFEDTKTSDSNSATYESNREGITTSSSSSSNTETTYDANREGVRAWIQQGFINELTDCINDCSDKLHATMEALLREYADQDLSILSNPAVSVKIDFDMLSNTPYYEKLAYLRDLYLGDMVYTDSNERRFRVAERITGVKYDCIEERMSDMSFETLSYVRSGFVPGIANLMAKTGTIIKYTKQDALEDGYGGYLKTGYGVDLTTL